jgi:Sulfotransferase family
LLVSHSHRFIYLKTRKTASSSVELVFERYCLPPDDAASGNRNGAVPASETEYGIVGARGHGVGAGKNIWWNHMPGRTVRKLLPPETWEQYYKFCCVRNPWDKVVSAFHFLNRDIGDLPLETRRGPFREWLLKTQVAQDSAIFSEQGVCLVDQFIRYERLEADVATVCARVGLPAPEMKRLRSGPRPTDVPYTRYFDDETRAHVASQFARDIDFLGYRFGE